MVLFKTLSFLVFFSLILFTHQTVMEAKVHVLYSWIFPDFQYPSENAKSAAIEQGDFIAENAVILDSDYYFSSVTSTKRIFVTTPRFRNGIPATLSEITRNTNVNSSYLLSPFPSIELQRISTCDGPISVYRIHIDKCGLLWVLDTGRIETFTNPRRACPPKLLIYDLNRNDELIVRYEFPEGSINDRSNLATLVTESYQQDCRDSVAYIADVNAFGLVMYSMAEGTSWRVESNFFYPFPHKGTVVINRVTFDLMDGIFGLALSPPADNPRKLFFHSFASVRESWVPTSVLRNRTLIQNTNALRIEFRISEDVREGQSSLEVMTDDGILIYSLMPQTAIACWNSAHPFKKEYQHILYQDIENLQFISGMKLKGNILLITSSRLQNYIAGNLNTSDTKYRIIVIDDVDQLLKGTPCKNGPVLGKSPFKPPSPSLTESIILSNQNNKASASSHY